MQRMGPCSLEARPEKVMGSGPREEEPQRPCGAVAQGVGAHSEREELHRRP